jgi:hypothetical protein
MGVDRKSVPTEKVTHKEAIELVARTGMGAKLDDDVVLRIYGRKGVNKATDVADDEGVHVSTVNAIWRKAVRRELLGAPE